MALICMGGTNYTAFTSTMPLLFSLHSHTLYQVFLIIVFHGGVIDRFVNIVMEVKICS